MADPATQEIVVVDTLVARPGEALTLRDRYMVEYAPTAIARGMRLIHRWMSPPMVLGPSQTNTLTFVWTVTGTPGWWQMRRGAMASPEAVAFWREIAPLIERRERTFHADSSDV